jgi:hypothetical protein
MAYSAALNAMLGNGVTGQPAQNLVNATLAYGAAIQVMDPRDENGDIIEETPVDILDAYNQFWREEAEKVGLSQTDVYVPEYSQEATYLTDSDGNIMLDASHIGAVPDTRKVNGKALSSDITLSVSDLGAVPTSRTINGKKLSSNITLGAGDFKTVKDIQEYDNHAFTPLPSSSDAYVEIASCSLRRSLFVDAWFFRAAIKTKKSINETVSVLNIPTDATPQKNIALAAYSSGAHFNALINDSGNIRITPMITGTGQSGFSGIGSGVTLHLSGFWFADE